MYLIIFNTNNQIFNLEQNMHVKRMFWVTWQNIFFWRLILVKFKIYMYKSCISLILEMFGLIWLYVYIYFIFHFTNKCIVLKHKQKSITALIGK